MQSRMNFDFQYDMIDLNKLAQQLLSSSLLSHLSE